MEVFPSFLEMFLSRAGSVFWVIFDFLAFLKGLLIFFGLNQIQVGICFNKALRTGFFQASLVKIDSFICFLRETKNTDKIRCNNPDI